MRAAVRVAAAVSISSVVLVRGGLAGRAIAAQQPASPKACECDPDPLEALDAHIQERFQTVDNRRFGYGRVATVSATPHVFTAETLRESGTVSDLERAGLRVVMYLAGRGVLRGDTPALRDDVFGRPAIRGPVVVTPGAGSVFPPPADLLRESRRAMQAFGRGVNSTEFEQGGWNFVARPVRVSSQTCLMCHREPSAAGTGGTLRTGDALGAVLYGYLPM
jgi:hypothetical protein